MNQLRIIIDYIKKMKNNKKLLRILLSWLAFIILILILAFVIMGCLYFYILITTNVAKTLELPDNGVVIALVVIGLISIIAANLIIKTAIKLYVDDFLRAEKDKNLVELLIQQSQKVISILEFFIVILFAFIISCKSSVLSYLNTPTEYSLLVDISLAFILALFKMSQAALSSQLESVLHYEKKPFIRRSMKVTRKNRTHNKGRYRNQCSKR